MKYIFFLLLPIASIAQKNVMRIGCSLPDLKFQNVENFHDKPLELRKFIGKKLIIDFWNKGCGGCISAMPKLTRLQRKFDSSLVIITVTSDSKKDFLKLKERSFNVKNFNLPVIWGDSILIRIFPHTSVPYYAWIDEFGILRGTSESTSINIQNFDFFVKTGRMNPEIAITDTIHSYEAYFPLEMKTLNKDIYFSCLKRTERKIFVADSNIQITRSSKNATEVMYLNMTVVQMLAIMYNQPEREITTFDGDLSYLLRPTDYNEMESWEKKSMFSYRIKVNRRNANIIPFGKDDLRDKLHKEFGIVATVEKLIRKTYVLKSVERDSPKRIKEKISDSITTETTKIENDEGYIYLRRAPIAALISSIAERLNNRIDPMEYTPVIDETNFEDLIDIKLEFDDSLKGLNKELIKYGLYVTTEDRVHDFLVLKRDKSAF